MIGEDMPVISAQEEARRKVAKLVMGYQALTPAQIKTYHEAKTKQGFVHPLFRCHGWDFDNVGEVTPEEKASKGRVDYAFKLKGVSRFYLEVKQLKADLDDAEENYLYLLGLLQSRLMDFCFRRLSAPFRGDFRSANRQFIEPLPIRRIGFSGPIDTKMQEDLVALVQTMLHLHRELHQIPTERTEARHEVERQMKHTDEAIDTIVYDLYGLNKGEKETVDTAASALSS